MQKPPKTSLLSKANEGSPKFSIVIPSRNESTDIASTLRSCLNINYPFKEIIVVDDSTDDTPEIVSKFEGMGVTLIHRSENKNGCCGARNTGMKASTGDIVVLMNSDNRPRSDFLQQILPHYLRGADYLIVRSNVINRNTMWAEYLYCIEKAHHYPDPSWSEGFSVRRAAVSSVGYIPGDFPVPFCRDVLLDRELRKAGFEKVVDTSIEMDHVVPDTFWGFWNQWVWRGTFSAPNSYYFLQLSLTFVCFRETLKAARALLFHLLVFPTLVRLLKYTRNSPKGWTSIPSLFCVSCVQSAATTVGNYKGIWRVWRAEARP